VIELDRLHVESHEPLAIHFGERSRPVLKSR
jgi:hypothetical protein